MLGRGLPAFIATVAAVAGARQSGLASSFAGIQDRRQSLLRRYGGPGHLPDPYAARQYPDQPRISNRMYL